MNNVDICVGEMLANVVGFVGKAARSSCLFLCNGFVNIQLAIGGTDQLEEAPLVCFDSRASGEQGEEKREGSLYSLSYEPAVNSYNVDAPPNPPLVEVVDCHWLEGTTVACWVIQAVSVL